MKLALSQLPDRFQSGDKSEAFKAYVSRKYGTYGHPKAHAIQYNCETQDNQYRWVEHPSSCFNAVNGLRFVGNAHDIRGDGGGNVPYFDRAIVEHTGWFVDSFQDETVCGQVYQLPSRGGKSVYVPAVSDWCGNDGALIDFNSSTDDLIDAIRWADSMAERLAESEREYQAKADAEQRIEEIDDEVKEMRSGLATLIRELRANCDRLTGMLVLRETIREHIQRVKAECESLRQERAKIETEGLPEAW